MSGPYRTEAKKPDLEEKANDWELCGEEIKVYRDSTEFCRIERKKLKKESVGNRSADYKNEFHISIQTSSHEHGRPFPLKKKEFVLEESDLRLFLKQIKSFYGYGNDNE